jgi:hypothetical protein
MMPTVGPTRTARAKADRVRSLPELHEISTLLVFPEILCENNPGKIPLAASYYSLNRVILLGRAGYFRPRIWMDNTTTSPSQYPADQNKNPHGGGNYQKLFVDSGGPGWIRTNDQTIMSRLR